MTRAVTNGPQGGSHAQRYSTMGEKMRAEPMPPVADQTFADDASAKTADDSASMHSTSSKSSFWPSSLRKRAAERPRNSTEKERPRNSTNKERPGRLSEVQVDHASGEDATGLGLEVEMELQKQGKDGGQWGIGDEARMNLE